MIALFLTLVTLSTVTVHPHATTIKRRPSTDKQTNSMLTEPKVQEGRYVVSNSSLSKNKKRIVVRRPKWKLLSGGMT